MVMDDGGVLDRMKKSETLPREGNRKDSDWDKLPDDLHSHILAHLPIPSIIRSRAVCRGWGCMILSQEFKRLHETLSPKGKPWLFVCSSYDCRENSCAYDPNFNVWRILPLTFIPVSMRFPLIAAGGLLFIKGAYQDSSKQSKYSLSRLTVCNPITKMWTVLPPMIRTRLNFLIGIIEDSIQNSFKVIIAGGISESGGDYECTTELYDSITNSWSITGPMPREYTVQTTVWASKTVYCKRKLFCLISAKPSKIISYDIEKKIWEEVKIPQPEGLFSSFLVQRRGNLLLIGDVRYQNVCQRVAIWELKGGDAQSSIEKLYWSELVQIPSCYVQRFCKGAKDFNVKCVGNDDMLYFFKDSHSEILLCDLSCSPTTWSWLPHCPLSNGLLKFSVRALLVEPTLYGATLTKK
ncbi:hypothetical protein KP509_35G040900 [Ceratopteris richardii]|nr:hypothetical protein KP509_35G040900 [Ceratopteris richardii]KAH7282631.1 hypothetical protein KP509_35G040900 [Ceratopteris richardii]